MKFRLVENLLEDLDSNRRALLKKLNNNVISTFEILEMDPTVNIIWKDNGWIRNNVYNYIFSFYGEKSFDEIFPKDIVEFKGEGKFLPWLGKIFIENKYRFYNKEELKKALDYFYKQSKQFQNKDIFQFKTEEDLINKVNELSANEKSTYEIKIDNLEKNMDIDNLPYPDFDIKKAKEGVNLVYHDSKWLVYVPKNYEASVVLRGQNAEWCTGWHEKNKRMDDKYNEYTEDGSKLYIIINKQNSDEKYQVAIHPDGSWNEFNDAKNNSLTENELKEFFDKNDGLCNFFGKLTNYDLCIPEEIINNEYPYEGETCPDWVKKVNIKQNITKIKDYAFCNCTSLSEISIPDNIIEIGNYAFAMCESLNTITIPNSVTKIGQSAFQGCEFLKSIIFKEPCHITKIEEHTFYDCANLESITIPSSVTQIAKNAFYGCDELTIKSNSEYVQNYCEANNIKWERLNNEI